MKYGLLLIFCGMAVATAQPALASEPRVVVVPALQRVLRDDVAVKGSGTAQLSLAQGETESFQIVVVNQGSEPLNSVDLRWTTLSGPCDSPPVIRPFKVHYVQITEPSHRQRSKPGWYPDALIPFADPYTGTRPKRAKYSAWGTDIPSGQVQSYWLDLVVPRKCAAGEYQGLVRMTNRNGFEWDVPVTVTVWDFALPEVPSLPTHFTTGLRSIARAFGVASNSPQLADFRTKIHELLQEHRLTVLGIPRPPADRATGHAQITPGYLRELREHIESRKLKICHLPMTVGSPLLDALGAGFPKLAVYLDDINRMLRDNPWIPPVFIYMIDEPRSRKAYAQVHRLGNLLRSQNSRILNLVPGALKPKPGWPPLGDAIDIWVYHIISLDEAAVAARQSAGKRVWAYTALSNTRTGAPSWLTDAPLVSYMVPFWTSWSLKLDGFLYWNVLGVPKTGDPWVDPTTHVATGGEKFHGEGCLILAGRPAGVDGPLPTIRLKTIRDGLDCYDYLTILAELGGQDKADQIARGLTSSFTTWNRDYRAYLAAREQLADEIMSRTQARQ